MMKPRKEPCESKTKERIRTSLILSTYNNSQVLALCLESIRQQKHLPDEVIVGDDGSTDETRRLLDSLRTDFPVPLIHVWQEDDGFRLAKIRNKCIACARYEYIIQIDGDIILHPLFVHDHLAFAAPGHYLKGTRLTLGKGLTAEFRNTGRYFIPTPFSRGIGRRPNAIRCMAAARYLAPRRKKSVSLGANMSYLRSDAIAINGYDEAFSGWGGEDDDFAARLLNAGCSRLSLKFAALCYHLWHREADMSNAKKNAERYRLHRNELTVRCTKGIEQYL